jgi:hypothetical protein
MLVIVMEKKKHGRRASIQQTSGVPAIGATQPRTACGSKEV